MDQQFNVLAVQRFNVFRIFFRDFALLLVAFVQIKAVTESDAVAGRHDQISCGLIWQFLEVVLAKRIGGKQTVIPDVPPGRVTRIFGVIEYGHTDGLGIHWTVIVAPGCALAPGCVIAHAFAVYDVALTDLAFKPHGFCQAHGHGAFLGVAESHLAVGGMECYLEIQQSLVVITGIVNAQRPVIRADDLAIRGHPFVTGLNQSLFLARFDLAESVVDDLAEGLVLRPKILAVNRAMSEPERAMVLVVAGLIQSILHGPVASHGRCSRTHEGVTVGPRHVGKVILGKEPAVNLDPQPVSQLVDVDALRAGGRWVQSGANGDRESDHLERTACEIRS